MLGGALRTTHYTVATHNSTRDGICIDIRHPSIRVSDLRRSGFAFRAATGQQGNRDGETVRG